MVSLVASNTVQVAQGHYLGAGVVGFAISALWWANAKQSGRSDALAYPGFVYALGAAAGTMTGMAITHWMYS